MFAGSMIGLCAWLVWAIMRGGAVVKLGWLCLIRELLRPRFFWITVCYDLWFVLLVLQTQCDAMIVDGEG